MRFFVVMETSGETGSYVADYSTEAPKIVAKVAAKKAATYIAIAATIESSNND